MLTDDQLAARIGPRLRAELAALPVPDMPAALRRRRARRARAAAALAALPLAGAAAAAAVFLPGRAAPAGLHAQDAAYVVSRVTRAIGAVPGGTVLFIKDTSDASSLVMDLWVRGPDDTRIEAFKAGKLVSDTGWVTAGTTTTTVFVDYRDKTWWRRSSSARAGNGSSGTPGRSSARYECGAVTGSSGNPRSMAAQLRAWVSCGSLKAGGTTAVGGIAVIELTSAKPAKDGAITTWYVNSSTYLPVRMTRTGSGDSSSSQDDFQWLPPTAANLARLDLPAAPQGFTQTAPNQ
jgi:hypothetical protein